MITHRPVFVKPFIRGFSILFSIFYHCFAVPRTACIYYHGSVRLSSTIFLFFHFPAFRAADGGFGVPEGCFSVRDLVLIAVGSCRYVYMYLYRRQVTGFGLSPLFSRVGVCVLGTWYCGSVGDGNHSGNLVGWWGLVCRNMGWEPGGQPWDGVRRGLRVGAGCMTVDHSEMGVRCGRLPRPAGSQ